MTKDYLKRQFSNFYNEVIKGIEGITSIGNFVTIEPTIVPNMYITYTGAEREYTSGSSAIVRLDVAEGEIWEISSSYQFASALYALYSDNTFVTAYPSEASENTLHKETVQITIPQGVNKLKVSSFNTNSAPIVIKKFKSSGKLKVDLAEVNNRIENYHSNVLYGKKWAACGDSYTAGGGFANYTDSQGNSGKDSDAYDKDKQMFKTYPWWIGNRNKMDIQLLAWGGADFTNLENASIPFSNPNTEHYNYTQIPTDCDYITLMFGLNETYMTTEQIGTKTDSDNTTLWGAYNTVLEDILTKNPTVKIGIIIADGWLTQTYHDALIDIAKYWGIPYLDLRNSDQVPMLINGRLADHSAVAQTIRDSAFKISETENHPNVKAYEYRSTIIENFLRSL